MKASNLQTGRVRAARAITADTFRLSSGDPDGYESSKGLQ